MQKCVNPKCNNQFEPKSRIHRYCSDQCRKAARGREYRWAREIALERDSHTCQDCGAHDCRLETHHIQPLCMGGTNKLYNLVTLCVRCHKAIHKSWSKWYDYTPGGIARTTNGAGRIGTTDRAA
jgi:5-methylcytosine-specific restriction endonuclease McrA